MGGLLAGCGKPPTIHQASANGHASVSPASMRGGSPAAASACAEGMPLQRRAPIAVGTGAGALVAGNGALWVAREQAGTITRLAGSRREVFRVGPTPLSLTLGFGKLWVALRDADRVVYLDTHTLALKRAAGVPVPVSVLTAFGRVWVLSLDAQALYPLDSAGEISGEPLYAPVGDPIGLVQAGGELWMLGAGEGGLSPVNVSLGRVVRAGFDLPGRMLSGLSASGRTIWLGEPLRKALLRVDAASAAVAELPLPSGARPSVTAVGQCGVWVASRTGKLELVDPKSGSLLAPVIRVGRSIAALTVAGSGVWASDPVDGTVVYVRD